MMYSFFFFFFNKKVTHVITQWKDRSYKKDLGTNLVPSYKAAKTRR
jgi:hypothetical protein